MTRPQGRFIDPGHRAPTGSVPRRWRDLAILLPVFGALLLLPPIVALTVPAGTLGNVPVIVLYLFGVWAALILAAALTARGLRGAARSPPSTRTLGSAPTAEPDP